MSMIVLKSRSRNLSFFRLFKSSCGKRHLRRFSLCLLFTIIFIISSLSFQKLPRGCDKPVETSSFSLFVQACLQIGRTWWKPLRNPAFLPVFWPITVTAYLENAAFGRKSFTDQICQRRSGNFEIQWTQFSSLFFHWWDLSCGVLCPVHVIWTEHRMSKLVLNVKYLLLLSFLTAAKFYNLGHIQGIIRVP